VTQARVGTNALAAIEQRDEEARRALVLRAHDRLLRDLDPRLLEALDSDQARWGWSGRQCCPRRAGPRHRRDPSPRLVRAITDEAIGFGPLQRS
jgi:hypothetical protein